MKNEEPKIQKLSERVVVCVSFTGNCVGKPEIFANLFNKLGGWAGSKGLMSSEADFLKL